MRELKQSTAHNAMVLMIDSSDHVTGKAGLTLTITASKDGAAFASISPTVTERGSGWYNLALTTSHTDTLGSLALHVTSTGADPYDEAMLVRSALAQDAYAVLVPSGNTGQSVGILWAGTLSAISSTSVTLPGGHNLDHAANLAVILTGGTAAQGRSRYLTYSGAGEVWTVDPAWTAGGESAPTGPCTALVIPAPKVPTTDIPNVNTTKFGGTAVTARDLGAGVIAATVSDKTGYALSGTGLDVVLDTASSIETGLSLRGWFRLVGAVLAGKVSIVGSTVAFRNAVADTKARVTATASGGQRTAVTTDQT